MINAKPARMLDAGRVAHRRPFADDPYPRIDGGSRLPSVVFVVAAVHREGRPGTARRATPAGGAVSAARPPARTRPSGKWRLRPRRPRSSLGITPTARHSACGSGTTSSAGDSLQTNKQTDGDVSCYEPYFNGNRTPVRLTINQRHYQRRLTGVELGADEHEDPVGQRREMFRGNR